MSVVFTSGLAKICGMATAINYLSDTIKVALTSGLTSPYTENQDHDFMSEVSEMPNVTGYVGGFGGAGRQTLGSKTIAADDTNNRVRFTGADVAYGALGTGEEIRGYIFIKEITNDAASPVIAHRQLAADVPTNGSSITAEVATNDVLRINT